MTNTETDGVGQLVSRTFLSRVPGIMAAQPELTIDEAIKAAFDADEAFCYRMMMANESERRGLDKGAEEAIRLMCARVYDSFKSRGEPMNSVIADKRMNRADRIVEAQRLSKLTERAIDWRTIDCRCDENPYCEKCKGQGAYHEAFYLSCNHAVIDGADLECEANGCAEREARKAEAALNAPNYAWVV